MTVRRPDGLAVVVAALAVGLLTVWPCGRLAAQDSQFGIRGLGAPGRWESVRARATGGAFAPFDPFSALMEAPVADVRRVAAGITGGTSWRATDLAGATASLRATRFPAFVLAGPVWGRLILGVGFSTYLDKSFGVTRDTTLDLRGQPEPVTDEITSDGAVADLRLAAATRLNRRLALGVAIHALTGSTRVAALRQFQDTATYKTSEVRDEVAYEGLGGSASALLDVGGGLRLAGWLRSDTHLRADLGGRTVATDDLPFAAGAAVRWSAGSQATVAGAVAWRYWAGAGPNSYDTFNWSVGAEVGSVRLPLRLGVRGGQLPFGPTGSAPSEFAVAGGIGRQFSQDRGRLDLTVERLERKGGGLTERVWTVLLGLTIRP